MGVSLSAVIVTRGDVDLAPIVATFEPPLFDDVIVWNNGAADHHAPEMQERTERAAHVPVVWANAAPRDLVVYGRYAALRAVAGGIVYVQDDDCVLPAHSLAALAAAYEPGRLVCNMPAPFRAHYTDSGLVGFGAVFDADLPQAAFDRLRERAIDPTVETEPDGTAFAPAFMRCCDVVFTTLTPMTWVDVPYENLAYATGPDRMFRQPGHVGERAWMLALARSVRDA